MSTKSYEALLFNSIKNGQKEIRSVYDIWLELGNTGTAEDFINSLKGTSATVIKDITIEASSWVSSDGIYKTTITNDNISSDDVVNVDFKSISDIISNGILGYTNSIDGGFEIYSNFQPSTDIMIDYVIITN